MKKQHLIRESGTEILIAVETIPANLSGIIKKAKANQAHGNKIFKIFEKEAIIRKIQVDGRSYVPELTEKGQEIVTCLKKIKEVMGWE